ncbi:hypothetical protein CHKEEEPN_0719 [Methylorubrum podarium]|nr:hypothetical protein CHKEEEPN_0719 [Methylorubrum podarium]
MQIPYVYADPLCIQRDEFGAAQQRVVGDCDQRRVAYRATGRNLFAIGGNPEVARLAGIDVRRYTIVTFAAARALAGVAAVVLAARLNSSQPSPGLGIELDTIAAVLIGGASLVGGVGSIAGTLIGVLIIGVLRNGLNLLGVSPFFQMVVIGLVIALAVAFDTLGRERGK